MFLAVISVIEDGPSNGGKVKADALEKYSGFVDDDDDAGASKGCGGLSQAL
ncbi:hypothetical protein [Sinorhizobium fredii]|uniref:hypothetical protein n=1 Tax=Rhizobium fredii TaxID=380 RepID=UPI00131A256C|nr:hypothetical protein [Sinorhizobium fredii]